MLKLIFALFLAGFAFVVVMKVAKDREWKMPASLAAIFAGALGWFTDFADGIGAWFSSWF